jgi:hypothetical protein
MKPQTSFDEDDDRDEYPDVLTDLSHAEERKGPAKGNHHRSVMPNSYAPNGLAGVSFDNLNTSSGQAKDDSKIGRVKSMASGG